MKKIRIILTVALLVFVVNVRDIFAASYSISGGTSYTVGGSGHLSVILSGSGFSEVSVSTSDSSVVSISTSKIVGVDNNDNSVKITANKAGTATISFKGFGVLNNGEEVTISQNVTIKVSAPYVPPVKTPEQIAKEREEAAAAAEKLEKERLEAELIKRKNTPLINTIDVISRSDKRMDSSLIVLSTEFEKFNYEFTLPKKVNTFDLEIVSDQEDVSVTYDVSHALTETETEKVIPITVTGPEFSQDFKLTVKKDTTPDSILSVAGKEMVVYSDDFFKDKMVEFGFVHNEYPLSDLLTSYYTFGDVNLQLLVDSEDNARWYTLDSEMQPIREVVLLVGEDKKPFFAYDTDDDDLVHQALHGGRYKSIPYVIDESLAAVDSGLKFKTDYMAWEFEGNHVVYGFDHTAKEGTYLIDGNQNAKFAVVAFDAETDNSTKTVAITSSVGLVTVSGYVLATTLMNIRKRKED